MRFEFVFGAFDLLFFHNVSPVRHFCKNRQAQPVSEVEGYAVAIVQGPLQNGTACSAMLDHHSVILICS
jgi:hypothetical protein